MSGLQPGDPAPGGGLIGDVGFSAEKFIAFVVGRQEKGAIPNGRRIRKANSEPGDRTPDGTEGTIVGSICLPGTEAFHIEGQVVTMGYMIEWDNDEQIVFTTDLKVEEL